MEPGMSQLVAALDSTRAFCPGPLPALGGLRAEFCPHLRLEPGDRAAVEALVDVRPETGVFLSSAWLSGYMEDRPEGIEYGMLLLRDEGAVRGAVPLAVRQTLTQTRVSILGGGLRSDRVDLLAARGMEAAAADALLAWLRETFGPRGFLLELRDVCSTSAIWGAVHRCGLERTQRLAMQPREIYPLPYLPLAGEPAPGDTPWASRRRSLDRHRRWLDRRGDVSVRRVDDPAQVAETFETLAGFLRARCQRRGERSVLDDPGARRFHRRVLPQLLAAGRLRMLRIAAGDRTVAAFYGLAAGGWWGYYLAGYDRDWAGRIHLGQVNLAAAIAAATDEGATTFDFLKGAERVKYNWPVRERTTIDADVFSPNCGVQLTRATRATRDATAALTRSARALFTGP
jgi:CelD/BcsL family acetyltransferase involved in cellulose biosynthesis